MSRRCTRAAAIVFVLSIVAASAHAQTSSAAETDAIPSFGELFTNTLRDFRYLPSAGNLDFVVPMARAYSKAVATGNQAAIANLTPAEDQFYRTLALQDQE